MNERCTSKGDFSLQNGHEGQQSRKRNSRETCLEPCAIERGMRVIGGKWTGSIIYHLKDEPVRFNDLVRMLGGASKKMIDQRLKELESRNMVVRKVLNDRPVAVSYELTDFGRSALKVLDAVRQWSEANDI
ncbi:helix-turn-helix domain-containing protein [Aestuariibacter sp. A3R04]|uniref:winged helix-turn-helix transcriptional regulator n=1 Tax=Aestuariibacter sp. A3R04 TaxID=2841571 RepID=UPI001C085163|nr:helix-turn-helix domain-containing protein [Aestuariibacter sp. A3R04]MBU3021201.1 helix-turn-helix transcriptional regulator [Aestuariibacter sp. A3R04]